VLWLRRWICFLFLWLFFKLFFGLFSLEGVCGIIVLRRSIVRLSRIHMTQLPDSLFYFPFSPLVT
jgi:hypothetical protein